MKRDLPSLTAFCRTCQIVPGMMQNPRYDAGFALFMQPSPFPESFLRAQVRRVSKQATKPGNSGTLGAQRNTPPPTHSSLSSTRRRHRSSRWRRA